jgi:peptidoglycan/xylan/chitin deacetylase (PgdA/CDA1 family)
MSDLLILCYHGISDTWPAPTTVRPADFESQLREFVERGYRGATLSEALVVPPAEKTLVVTFDDAHRSVAELAAPMMRRLGLPGTVFVPTAYAGSERPMGWDGYDVWLGTEHEGELLCMGWEQLHELAAAGWEVGSHTKSHPRLSKIAEAPIREELADSRRECEEHMDTPCTSIAYPYSDYDDRAVRAAAACGYRFAVTVPRGPAPSLPLQWPRVGVYNGDSARRVLLRARARRLSTPLPVRAVQALRGRRR